MKKNLHTAGSKQTAGARKNEEEGAIDGNPSNQKKFSKDAAKDNKGTTRGPSMAQIADMVGKDPMEAEELKLANKQLSTLPDLAACASLKKLDISGNNLPSLDAIGGCKGLTWLNVKENQIQELTPMARNWKMQVLNIGSNGRHF